MTTYIIIIVNKNIEGLVILSYPWIERTGPNNIILEYGVDSVEARQ